ncbi:MAG TPA: hypothetical protein VGF14_04775 [Alphaproteobacteria bacterium]
MMPMPYESASGLRVAAQETFDKYFPVALSHYPDATPSHVGFDCADEAALEVLKDFSKELGEMVEKPHNGKMIIFVKLDQPLLYNNHKLPYLEFIGPDSDPAQRRETGVRTFVSTSKMITGNEKIPYGPNFVLRFHEKSAADISGLGF